MAPYRLLWSRPFVLYVLWILTAANLALAARNVTVDDTSSEIIYTGTWLTSHTQTTRYNSTTHYTRVEGSYATFSFTGASQIYFMGYGLIASAVANPYMQVTFDGQSWRVDQSRTTETRSQAILWTSGAIDPTVTHTIVCTKATADNGGMDMNVDAFILTIPDTTVRTPISSPVQSSTSTPPPPSASTSTSDSTSSSSPTSTTYIPLPDIWTPPSDPTAAQVSSSPSPTTSPLTIISSPNTNIAAIIGGTLGALCLIAIVAAIFFCLGRRRRRNEMSKEPIPLYRNTDLSPTDTNPPSPHRLMGGETGSMVGVSRRTGTTKRREREEEGRNRRGGGTMTSDSRTDYSNPLHTESGWASGPPAYTPMNSDPVLARSETSYP